MENTHYEKLHRFLGNDFTFCAKITFWGGGKEHSSTGSSPKFPDVCGWAGSLAKRQIPLPAMACLLETGMSSQGQAASQTLQHGHVCLIHSTNHHFTKSA